VKHMPSMKISVLSGLATLVLAGWSSPAWAFGRMHVNSKASSEAVYGTCGTPIRDVPCAGRIATPGPEARRTIFLNRVGGTYSHGTQGDSRSNITALGTGGTVTPNQATDAEWADVLQCVQGLFADFNVDVTDVEPTSGEYVECVMAGSSGQIGLTSAPGTVLLGVADTNGLQFNICKLQEHGVAFAFSDSHGSMSNADNRLQLCITAAHETAHTMGLDHEILDVDMMSYANVPNKRFVDADSSCADQSLPQHVQNCVCDPESNTQNSHQVLLDYLGPNDKVAPTLTIDSPVEGAKVGPGFTINATATDDVLFNHVELLINGETAATDFSPPFTFAVPTNIAIGPLTFDVVAIDKADNRTTVTRNVTVEPGCASSADCEAQEACVNQACLGDVGHACEGSTDCADGLCVGTPGSATERFCTRTCTTDGEACPSGYACDNSTGSLLKCNPASDSGGCATSAGRRGDVPAGVSALGVLGLMTLLGARARRRRRG
jgi:hypothetical protein